MGEACYVFYTRLKSRWALIGQATASEVLTTDVLKSRVRAFLLCKLLTHLSTSVLRGTCASAK